MCKLTLATDNEVAIVRCIVQNEHPDNDRFAADCERWFDHPIIEIRSTEYADCWDVWERRRYLSGHSGAPCTIEMKKVPRQDFERDWGPHASAYGYTIDERHRADRYRKQNPDINLLTPLIDYGLTAADCAALVERAGIARPEMYRLGFKHNNCRTCVKARSPGYWANVRRHFPDDFYRLAKLSRELGWTPCCTGNGAPIWLDELPNDIEPRDDSAGIECSLLCYIAEQEIRGVVES
jgi:hypothetical protein